MRKVKLQLPTNEWQDINTKYAPDDSRFVDQNAFTNGTKNIDTEQDGTIRKMKGGVQFATLASKANDQHEVVFSDGVRHLLIVEGGILKFTAGEPTMTTVTSGYSTSGNFEFATTSNRAYFGNGINPNQVYDKTASYGGVGYSVPQTKAMGAQVPGSAPTAALGAAGSNVPAGGHTYKVTFLYYDSEESNGSSASNLVTVTASNEQVDLTSVPTGGYGVTARKIYRDNNDGVYTLVGTISDNTTTTFSDTVAAGTTPIPTDNGIPPISGQITLFSDRLWLAQVSGEPFTLYFSEVGLPDIVQSTNFIQCNPEDPITALFVYRGRLVIFNRRSMGQILGTTKDSFNYDEIEGSVGCVDNRTIQEIVLNGVPTLVWLSDKGFYGFNGSSWFYLSDKIENIINTDIKQAVIQRNQTVHTNDADFNAGTASDGIVVAGGAISVRGYVDGTSTVGNNPRRTWNDTADWDGGDSQDNISTIGLPNTMSMPGNFSESPGTQGTRVGVISSGSDITLTSTSDWTGDTTIGTDGTSATHGISRIAMPFRPQRTGTVTNAFIAGSWSTGSVTTEIWSDGGGVPSAKVGDPGTFVATQGVLYWIVKTISIGVANMSYAKAVSGMQETVTFSRTNGSAVGDTTGLGNWVGLSGPAQANYTFAITPIADSGTWTSSIFDTASNSSDVIDITHTGTYPVNTGATTRIDAGDNLDFAGNIIVDETQSIVDHSGTTAVTLGSRRYWQIVVTLTTSNNLTVPTVGPVTLTFSDTAEWISDAVDTTADSTVYTAPTLTATTPGSSTAVLEIRTAATLGALSGATWFTFGAHAVAKFAQFRITLTKSGADIPSVSLLDFDWTIVSNLISPEIDTAVDPSGWDIFQSDFDTNGGTIIYEMRSATTSPGLSGAAWNTVTNGNFPPAALSTDQFVQWRATITATDTNVPITRSVTIRWLVGDPSSVRAASIFFSKNYYVSLAEFGSDENNILIQLDANGKWRIKKGLGVRTFDFFFNDPYFGSADSAVVGKFLQGLQDLGTDIEIDIRTRAFDFSEQFFEVSDNEKVPETIIIEGRGTGATYDVGYSLDNGATFKAMKHVTLGTTTFATTNNDELFSATFHADVDTNGLVGAKTIMYRVHTNDSFDIKLHRIKAVAFVTRKQSIITG